MSDPCKLRALEDENGKLKKLLAEAILDNAILKDVAAKNKMVTPNVKREAVAHACKLHDARQLRACDVLAGRLIE